jgi:hypothetical protein
MTPAKGLRVLVIDDEKNYPQQADSPMLPDN